MKKEMLDNIKTPCFIIDDKELNESLSGFSTAIKTRFSRAITSLSVKTNPLPFVLNSARLAGYYAEVVSDDEYKLALECGFPKSNIIYNGPLKSKESFIDAICNGALVNIETFREIEWLKELPSNNKKYSIGIRLNVNISLISPEDENHENDNSRFGFSAESEDFHKAIRLILNIPTVELNRIHIHRTSKTRSISFYDKLIKYAFDKITKYNLNIDQIDVGGGFYGIMENKPSYNDYSDVIFNAVSKYRSTDSTTIIIEPGNAIVASAFSFVTTVIDVKNHDGSNYVTIDGSRIDVDPLFRKNKYYYHIFYNHTKQRIIDRQIVCGCTCLEFDRLFEIFGINGLSVGDVIVFERVGAYTMALTPLFIRYWPDIYILRDGEPYLVRKKWTVTEFIQNNYTNER